VTWYPAVSLESRLTTITSKVESTSLELGHSVALWCDSHPNTTHALEIGAATAAILGTGRAVVALREAQAGSRALAEFEVESLSVADSVPLKAAEVRTAFPTRTLIRSAGYGRDAAPMETIVAQARDGVLSGDIKSAAVLEKFVAKNYIPTFHNYDFAGEWDPRGAMGYPSRIHPYSGNVESAGLRPLSKHLPFESEIRKLSPERYFSHTMTETIDGEKVKFLKTKFSRWSLSYDPWEWQVPTSSKTFRVADQRNERLFQELLASKSAPPSETALDQNVRRVAEMHWLSSQCWKFNRGSAAVAELRARALLEVAGIDSGRFKVGVDPNLTALSTTLSDYTANYKSLFEEAPRYFGH
jgi:hypothetical protein